MCNINMYVFINLKISLYIQFILKEIIFYLHDVYWILFQEYLTFIYIYTFLYIIYTYLYIYNHITSNNYLCKQYI